MSTLMDCNSSISLDTSSLLLTRRSECNCASVRSTCCFEYQRVHVGTSEIATRDPRSADTIIHIYLYLRKESSVLSCWVVTFLGP